MNCNWATTFNPANPACTASAQIKQPDGTPIAFNTNPEGPDVDPDAPDAASTTTTTVYGRPAVGLPQLTGITSVGAERQLKVIGNFPTVGSIDFVGCTNPDGVPVDNMNMPLNYLTMVTMVDSVAPLETYKFSASESGSCLSSVTNTPTDQTQVHGIVVDATVSANERVHRLDNRCNWKLEVTSSNTTCSVTAAALDADGTTVLGSHTSTIGNPGTPATLNFNRATTSPSSNGRLIIGADATKMVDKVRVTLNSGAATCFLPINFVNNLHSVYLWVPAFGAACR